MNQTDCAVLFSELRQYAKDADPFGIGGIKCPALRAIVCRRYAITRAIQTEIEAQEPNSQPGYVGALYYALGTIRDPDSIPWLTGRLQTPDASLVLDYWVTAWRWLPHGLLGENTHWLDGKRPWSRFFLLLAQHDLARDDRRAALLAVICRYFHDQEVVHFVADELTRPPCSPEATLIISSYLYEHGHLENTDACMSAINDMRSRFGGDVWLINVAAAIPHEKLVPELLDVLESTRVCSARDALRRITLCTDFATSEEWRRWYVWRANEPRSEWVHRTCEQVEKLFLPRVDLVRDLMHTNRKYWNDIAFLPLIRACMQYKELREEVAGWVVATYRPAWDAPLREIVEALFAEGVGGIDVATQESLICLGGSSCYKGTWEEFVCRQERTE